jgi:hypothetical protein
LPRAKKKKKKTTQKTVTEKKIPVNPQILEKLIEGVQLGDLKQLVKSWGYNIKENEGLKQNIDLLNALEINAFSKSQFADIWALKALKGKIWKKFKVTDPLPARLGLKTLRKGLKTALNSENVDKKYISHVFKLNTNLFHIVLEFNDTPFLVENEKAFSYQLIKPISRISSILDRDEGIVYIEAGDGRNLINSKNFEILENILKKTLKTSFERVRVRPFELKEIADKSSKHWKKVVFVTPREISGIEGVDRITVEGKDVVFGLKDIASRHEVNLEKVGAWSIIENDELLLSLDGRVKKLSLLDKE